jgi:hypothetical protein
MKRLLPECVQMRRATTSAVAAPAQTVEEYSATPGFRLSHATPWHLKTRYFVFRHPDVLFSSVRYFAGASR